MNKTLIIGSIFIIMLIGIVTADILGITIEYNCATTERSIIFQFHRDGIFRRRPRNRCKSHLRLYRPSPRRRALITEKLMMYLPARNIFSRKNLFEFHRHNRRPADQKFIIAKRLGKIFL